jgi:glucose-1-phosphate cytidylyltransferase
VTAVRPVSRYGELAVLDGRVHQFSEKPEAEIGLISGGYFVFNRSFFDYLTDDDRCVLELDPLVRLTKEGQLMSYAHSGYWHCMDTYRDYNTLNETWRRGAPWKVWE